MKSLTLGAVLAVVVPLAPLLWWVGDHELVWRPQVEEHMADSYCYLCYQRCHEWCRANGIDPSDCQCPECDKVCR
jgi:hypothetical protein